MSLYDDELTGRNNRAATLRDVIHTLGLDRRAKRVFDVVAATMGLIFFSPILLVTSIAIKLDSRGPIFIRENLYGYDNQTIQVLKFRLVHACAASNRSKPRLTRVGRIIHRTGVDELPQLFNVLRGEMSIVGPLRHGRRELSNNDEFKPGMTSWAQFWDAPKA
jgi:lipopolysaccharide/colanic/teichoic acid biosynthesis glycosyltransferase